MITRMTYKITYWPTGRLYWVGLRTIERTAASEAWKMALELHARGQEIEIHSSDGGAISWSVMKSLADEDEVYGRDPGWDLRFPAAGDADG